MPVRIKPADPRLPRGKDFNGKPFDGLHYAQVRGDLFVSGVSATDVGQGNLGDCFFLSSLAAVAKTHPELLKKAIARNADGTYTVTFKQPGRNTVRSVPVTVDGDFPMRRGGGPAFGRGLQRGASGPELWPAVFEKAYASLQGSFSTLNQGGYADDALAALTGKRATRLVPKDLSAEKLWTTLGDATRAQKPIVTGTVEFAELKRLTGRADLAGLIDGHAYALLGVHEARGVRYVDLYTPLTPAEGGNPAGGCQRTVSVPLADYQRVFDDLVIGAA